MKIKFHYSLLAILIVFIFTGLYIEILLFFIIILLHEMAHIITLLLFKQKVKTLNITILGAIIECEYKELGVIPEVVISIAGVFMNIILYIIIMFLDDFYYQEILLNYNLILIVFNLLPIYPLDGYKLIEGLFRFKNDPFFEQKSLMNISIFTLVVVFSLLTIIYRSLSIYIIFGFLIYHNLILRLKYTEFVLKKYVKRYKYKSI